MANLQVAYKQEKEHTNEEPGKFFRINNITGFTTTRYNNALPKTDNPEEFLKRPIRYCFSVFAREDKLDRLPSHHLYFFDNEEFGKTAYKKVMATWIDEQIEPYRKLIEKGKTLSLAQMQKCKNIQDLLPED